MKAIRAFEKLGFRVVRQGKHVIMSRGEIRLTIPQANPVDAYTMGGIIKDAGLSIEQFKELL